MTGWTCGACGRESPASARFCGHCGTPAAAAAAATWSCRDCGTPNAEGHAFCGGCGARAQATRAEELRLVTALFADISGFTTLADTLDTESLHEVITPLVGGLTRIAERYGGFVEKFSGDALLVLYGAPTSHEDDAQRALLAALDMHAELPALLAAVGPHAAHLTVHVGVNTGRVIARQLGSEQQSDYAVLGDSVILAQRLESACPPGQTYVGVATYELCKDEFAFEAVGALTLKGKLKPVEAFRLLGHGRVPDAGAEALVGRAAELAAVELGLAEAGLTTVVGDPGAGKTRLLAEVRRRAAARGTTWLAARCLSYGAPLAYWPLADLLRQELRVSPQSSPAEVADAVAAGLPAEAVPAALRLLGIATGGLPETARREVHEGVLAWLRAQAAAGPVTLALEDVHWADRSTIDVLAEVVRAPDRAVSVLLSARGEGLEQAEVVAAGAAHRVVQVGPFDAAGTTKIAAAVLAGRPAPGLVQLLTTRTNGNALHVRELARSLVENSALVDTVAGWDLRPGWDLASIPTTIERVYATRLDALTPPAAALLQLTSVVGRTTRLTLLRAVDDSGGIEAPLRQLVAAGMLQQVVDSGEPAVTFSHALLQDVVYERLLRKRRRELHRRVADVARSLHGDGDDTIALLARHLFLADAGEEAVEPLLRAGRRASGLYANDEAAVHLQRAVEVLREDDPRLPQALLELAEVQELRGAYDEALAGYEQVLDRTDDPRAWAGRLGVLRARGRYQEVLACFTAIARRFPPSVPASAAVWREAAQALALSGRFSDAVSMLRTTLRLLPDAEEELRGQALTQLAYAEGQLRMLENATAHADEAVALLDQAGTVKHLVRALRVAGGAHGYAGSREVARERLERGIAVAERVGLLEESAGCLLNLGLNELDDDPRRAASCYRSALAQFERLGRPSGRAQACGNLAEALARAGELDEAERYVDQALALAVAIGHQLTYADATLTRARIQLARRDPHSALSTAERAAALFIELDDADDAATCLELAAEARAAM